MTAHHIAVIAGFEHALKNTAHAAKCGRPQHPFRRPANPQQYVHAGAGIGGGDGPAHVAVGDQSGPRASPADLETDRGPLTWRGAARSPQGFGATVEDQIRMPLRRADLSLLLVRAASVGLALWAGCGGPEPFHSEQSFNDDASVGGADGGLLDAPAGSGGMPAAGTGGAPMSTGGGPGSGGATGGGSGGRASGGATATGGAGSGQSGGSPATGGMMMATGGAGAAAPGSGGEPATGGRGTGGAASGGAGTGGAGTGGAPTRLILSIDFVGGRSTAATAMSASETAGARPATNWNSAQGAMGSLASLTLSDGTTSNAAITWNALESGATTGTWAVNYADQPGDLRMLNGYLDPTWPTIPGTAPTLFTVSGLPAAIASGSYDVYVYTIGDSLNDTRSYQYGLGSQVQTVTQSSPPAVPPPSPFPYASANDNMTGTHVVFTAITGGTFSVTAKPVSGTNNRYRAPVNGVQIVWPAGS